jgi:hypothetical protein
VSAPPLELEAALVLALDRSTPLRGALTFPMRPLALPMSASAHDGDPCTFVRRRVACTMDKIAEPNGPLWVSHCAPDEMATDPCPPMTVRPGFLAKEVTQDA